MTRWWVAHPGARDFYSAPRFLHAEGKLARFYTDFWSRGPLPKALRARVPRYHSALPDSHVSARNAQFLLERLNRKPATLERAVYTAAQFGRWVAADIRKRELRPGDGIIGYTLASLELMELARKAGTFGVHMQVDPGPSWYSGRFEEVQRWPGAEAGTALPPSLFIERVKSEWETASSIIVNSRFAAASLIREGVAEEKIMIVPLSADVVPQVEPIAPPRRDEPLRVFFAGSVSVAKGFPYFAEAAKLLGTGFEFSAAGPLSIRPEYMQDRNWPVHLHGPVPRDRLWKLMRASHVLVFPTLSDGFGLVQLEAMAQGLPVIATPNCGDVVEDGVSGFKVAVRRAPEIAQSLVRLRDDPETYRYMSQQALKRVDDFSPANVASAFLKAVESSE